MLFFDLAFECCCEKKRTREIEHDREKWRGSVSSLELERIKDPRRRLSFSLCFFRLFAVLFVVVVRSDAHALAANGPRVDRVKRAALQRSATILFCFDSVDGRGKKMSHFFVEESESEGEELDGRRPGEGEEEPTYPADETLRMPLSVESGNVSLRDGRGASFAFEGEHGQVVLLAVRLTVLLLESVLAKLAAALGAEKVVRMPRLVQGRHAFLL